MRDYEIVYHDFDVFIVNDRIHSKMDLCPSCDSPAEPKDMESIGGGYQKVYGDLMQCQDCEDYYLVVENPKLDYPLPIRTRWSVPQIVFDDETPDAPEEEEEEDLAVGIITNPE